MPPFLFLSALIVGALATLFHLFLGKRFSELILYWLVGLAGFWLGQVASFFLHTRILMMGTLHPLEGVLGCLVALFIARWLKM